LSSSDEGQDFFSGTGIKVRQKIKKFDPGSEFPIEEGCFIVELSNAPDDPGVSIARARVPPGVTTRWHRLRATGERYVILEGEGVMEVGSLPPQGVKPGDVVLIPPLCRQRITNVSPRDLIFLAVCTPRFTPECYEEAEEIIPSSVEESR
jgi:mannose-6-phosphate isomerase-like protein (cupin superfamily)